MINIKSIKLKIDKDKIKTFLKDKQNRTYLIVGGALILSVVYLFLLIVPSFGAVSRISRKVKKMDDDISVVNSRTKKLGEMKGKLELLRKESSLYAKQLPAQKEVPQFLEDLASTAKRSNVKILSVTPYELTSKEQEKKQHYREMPIVITAKSGYHQLGHFVNELEEGDRVITLEDLHIQNDDSSPGKHNVRMILEAYVSVEEKK